MTTTSTFEDRIAIVTGAASGLGKAVVGKLRAAGARVAILDLSDEAGERAALETGSLFVRCDVADRESWAAAVADVQRRLGFPTVVHLNAGVMTRPPHAPIDDDPLLWIASGGYRRVMSVNVDGVVYGLEAIVPGMEEAGGGSVVVTASTAGLTPLPFDPFYSMSKHAAVALVRSIAPLLRSRKITINALCPGGLATPLVPKDLVNMGPSLMSAEEVAEAVLRLASVETTGGVWVKASSGPEYDCPPPAL